MRKLKRKIHAINILYRFIHHCLHAKIHEENSCNKYFYRFIHIFFKIFYFIYTTIIPESFNNHAKIFCTNSNTQLSHVWEFNKYLKPIYQKTIMNLLFYCVGKYFVWFWRIVYLFKILVTPCQYSQPHVTQWWCRFFFLSGSALFPRNFCLKTRLCLTNEPK